MNGRHGGYAAELVFKSAIGCAAAAAALYGAMSPLAGAEITLGYQGSAALFGAALGLCLAWNALRTKSRR